MGHDVFNELVDAHYTPLYRFALSLARREADACDLVQQTFFIWAKSGHQLREVAKAKTWLFTTLYREFLRGRRREQRSQSIEDLPPAAQELPAETVDQARLMDGQQVVEALQEVDLRHPLVVVEGVQVVGQDGHADPGVAGASADLDGCRPDERITRGGQGVGDVHVLGEVEYDPGGTSDLGGARVPVVAFAEPVVGERAGVELVTFDVERAEPPERAALETEVGLDHVMELDRVEQAHAAEVEEQDVVRSTRGAAVDTRAHRARARSDGS
jgi:hypothetical protein